MLQRVFSFIAAGLLILLYVATLVLGLMHDPRTTSLLVASIAATIIIPVLIYAMQLVYRILKKKNQDEINPGK